MSLADALNSVQNEPSEQRAFGSGSGGMSPLTMALLGLLAYKAVKLQRWPAKRSPRKTKCPGRS